MGVEILSEQQAAMDPAEAARASFDAAVQVLAPAPATHRGRAVSVEAPYLDVDSVSKSFGSIRALDAASLRGAGRRGDGARR